MMKLKKFIVTLSVMCFASLSLAGCGKKQDTNKLVVGTNAEFPPFEFVSVSGGVVDKYAGIDIEIIKKVEQDPSASTWSCRCRASAQPIAATVCSLMRDPDGKPHCRAPRGCGRSCSYAHDHFSVPRCRGQRVLAE